MRANFLLKETTDNAAMMNSPKTGNFLLIGLPSTGKTSFLAALWFAVQQTQSATALVLSKLDGDSGYLNRIRDAWLAYKPVPRTPTDTETFVSMHLKSSSGNEQIHLTFPDVSGESFKQQWASRQLSRSYNNCLKSADGGILFIHPKSITLPLRITEVNNLAALVDDSAAEESESEALPKPPGIPWDIEKAPTQVQLVALLQFMMQQKKLHNPFRLLIAVSAWDEVASSNLTPAEWVVRQLPLLDQFLASHKDKLDVAYFGISAQGGSYDSGDIAILQQELPAKRIAVVGDNIKNPHDITEPLLWLMP